MAWCSRSAHPLELYNEPANRFVAGFIGSPAMNFAASRFEWRRRAVGQQCRP